MVWPYFPATPPPNPATDLIKASRHQGLLITLITCLKITNAATEIIECVFGHLEIPSAKYILVTQYYHSTTTNQHQVQSTLCALPSLEALLAAGRGVH